MGVGVGDSSGGNGDSWQWASLVSSSTSVLVVQESNNIGERWAVKQVVVVAQIETLVPLEYVSHN